MVERAGHPGLPSLGLGLEPEDLEGLSPELSRIFGRYNIPKEDAEEMLEQLLLTYAYRGLRLRAVDRWLLGSITRRCRVFWQRRREEIARGLDQTLREMLGDPHFDPAEREGLRSRLEGLLELLPQPCRLRLARRYALSGEREVQLPRPLAPPDLRCLMALYRGLAVEFAGPSELSEPFGSSEGSERSERSEPADRALEARSNSNSLREESS